MSGDGDKVAGTVKEKAGEVTGNERLEGEGKGQKNAGKLENAVDSVTDTVGGAKDKVAGAAEAAKDKVSGDDK